MQPGHLQMYLIAIFHSHVRETLLCMTAYVMQRACRALLPPCWFRNPSIRLVRLPSSPSLLFLPWVFFLLLLSLPPNRRPFRGRISDFLALLLDHVSRHALSQHPSRSSPRAYIRRDTLSIPNSKFLVGPLRLIHDTRLRSPPRIRRRSQLLQSLLPHHILLLFL